MLFRMIAGARIGQGGPVDAPALVSLLLPLPGTLLVTVFADLLGDSEVLMGVLYFIGNASFHAVPVWLWRHFRTHTKRRAAG